ncbi:AAA family ATPase [candidate division KSB1 bacterium]|nr:AAA family ATPase [candidate division KSB1 bacterium]
MSQQSDNGGSQSLNGLKAKIWAVAGGKGGTGKSVISANMGIALSSVGKKVILIDGDLGGANLHTCLNIRYPKANLNDFLTNEKSSLEEILLDTPIESLKLISGGSELVGIANVQYSKKTKLLRHIEKLAADYIIVDLGAGQSYNTLDFFNLSNEGIIVCNPEPNAKLDAYSFLKSVVYRKILTSFKTSSTEYRIIKKILVEERNKTLQLSRLPMILGQLYPEAGKKIAEILQSFKPKLIMNKVRRRSQVDEALQLVTLASEYLGINLTFIGFIESDQKVIDAAEKMMPFLLQYPRCKASQGLFKILDDLNFASNNGRPFKHFYQFRKEMKSQAKIWK